MPKPAAASLVAVLVSSLMLLSGATAQDKAEKKAAKKAKADPTAQFFAVPKEISLSEDQTAQLGKIKEEYKTKAEEAVKAVNELLTAEQRKARNEARKAAQAEGKKGKELRAAVDAAVTLDADKKAKLAEVEKKNNELKKEINTKIMALLTAEQKAQIEEARKKNAKKA